MLPRLVYFAVALILMAGSGRATTTTVSPYDWGTCNNKSTTCDYSHGSQVGNVGEGTIYRAYWMFRLPELGVITDVYFNLSTGDKLIRPYPDGERGIDFRLPTTFTYAGLAGDETGSFLRFGVQFYPATLGDPNAIVPVHFNNTAGLSHINSVQGDFLWVSALMPPPTDQSLSYVYGPSEGNHTMQLQLEYSQGLSDEPNNVPEPATLNLLGVGAAVIVARAVRRRRRVVLQDDSDRVVGGRGLEPRTSCL